MALVVASGSFRPQVQFGAVGLDLPPSGGYAQPDQYQQQQLLHRADPFTLAVWSRPTSKARLSKPPKPSKEGGQHGR